MLDSGWFCWGIVFLLGVALGVGVGRANNPQDVREFTAHPAAVVAVALSPNGQYLATADASGNATVWNLDDRSPIRLHTLASVNTADLSVADTGDLAVAFTDTPAALVKLDGSVVPLNLGIRRAEAIAIAPDGSVMLAIDDQGTGAFWDRHGSPINKVTSKTLVRVGGDAPKLVNKPHVFSIPAGITFTEDGRYAWALTESIGPINPEDGVGSDSYYMYSSIERRDVVHGQRSVMLNRVSLSDNMRRYGDRHPAYERWTAYVDPPGPTTNINFAMPATPARWAAVADAGRLLILGQLDGTVSIIRSREASPWGIAGMLIVMAALTLTLLAGAGRYSRDSKEKRRAYIAAREDWLAAAPDFARLQIKLLALGMITLGLGGVALRLFGRYPYMIMPLLLAILGSQTWRCIEQGRVVTLWGAWLGLFACSLLLGMVAVDERPLQLTLPGSTDLLPPWTEAAIFVAGIALVTWARWVLTHPAIACHFADPERKK